jgi:hypothetical protein
MTRMQLTTFLTSIRPNINGAIKQHISWYASKSLNSMSLSKVLEFHNFIIQTLGLGSNILVLIYEYIQVQKN